MIEKMLAELKELDKFALAIATRVWENSPEAMDLNNVHLTTENIRDRIEVLADQLVKDFPDANPVIVGLMDGATQGADLLRHALAKRNYNFNYTTMSTSSYGDKLVSGDLTLGTLPKVKLYSRNVIIFDDVCDQGKTLKAVRDVFLTQYLDSLKLMVLVNKVQERPDGCEPDYVGFELPSTSFIIGMGLDYLGELRNTSSIKAANPQFLPDSEEQLKLERRNVLRKQIECFINEQAQEMRQTSSYKPDGNIKTPSSLLALIKAGEREGNSQIIVETKTSF